MGRTAALMIWPGRRDAALLALAAVATHAHPVERTAQFEHRMALQQDMAAASAGSAVGGAFAERLMHDPHTYCEYLCE